MFASTRPPGHLDGWSAPAKGSKNKLGTNTCYSRAHTLPGHLARAGGPLRYKLKRRWVLIQVFAGARHPSHLAGGASRRRLAKRSWAQIRVFAGTRPPPGRLAGRRSRTGMI